MVPSDPVSALRVVLTAQCNLRCAYCSQGARRHGRMAWPTLRAAVDALCASPAPEVELAFLGGEPLLEFELLRRAVLHGKERRGRGFRAALQTNGTLVTDEIASFLASEEVETQLSFDGVRSAQERRQPGTFDALDRLLDGLRDGWPAFLGGSVTAAVTLTPDNVTDLADSLEYLADKGVRGAVVTPLVTPTSGWHARDVEELERQLSVAERDARSRAERGLGPPLLARTAGPGPLGSQASGRSGDGADGAMCGILADGVTVDVDGSVVACVAFAASVLRPSTELMRRVCAAARMGGLRGESLGRRRLEAARALEGVGAFTHRERKRSGYRACAACPRLDECFVCPAAIAHGGDDPDRVPDIWCAWNQASLEHRAAFAGSAARERVRGAPHAAARARWRSVASADGFVYNGQTREEEVRPSHRPAPDERPPER
jgi:MoaA/NifB/PqqE/SkfB family radical SAM enzyme